MENLNILFRRINDEQIDEFLLDFVIECLKSNDDTNQVCNNLRNRMA